MKELKLEELELEEQQTKESLTCNFSRQELEILRDRYKKNIEVHPTLDVKTFSISTKQYTGYIVLPNHIIKINPKIKNIGVLLMLTYAFQELKFSDEDIWLSKNENIHEIIVRILIKKLSKIIDVGLYKNYNETEENASCLRGRIMFNQNLQQNLILKHRLYCRYSEFTQDILENQIIKSTLYNLRFQAWLTDETRDLLRRLYQRFEFVSIISIDQTSFKKLQFTRLNEHYRSILMICELLFRSSSIQINNLGEYESFAFLIDMNRLFEQFIRQYLKLNLTGYSVAAGSQYLDERKEIHLIPDIVISKYGSAVFIIDTKYKTLSDENAIRSDISQVLDYCLVYEIKNALLLYPKFEEEIHSEYSIRNTDKRIMVETIDLSINGQMKFNENISKFKDTVIKKFLT